ncbi:helix-turn-helix transcriptional regulator [Streptomyces spirodelae]|uniref:Helix-turn-helix transcriptional regulator n=1 Tax=Streptomyces spirodelae TaxID=2812904 RepID=A0ABS3WRY1_9ACTN|nr:helix-turn-helix transcriptional regulator [Streptomyces spirodelae]MBO8185884.1 helix-turn-helix transcriptional regulator [Streptomyces spirodelae]
MPADPPSTRALAARRRVGIRIRDARLWANLTQESLAERVGLDRKTIYRIELGTIGARLDWLVDLADALGMPLADIVRD